MSRPDAERALEIYRTFAKLTDQVVKFLGVARKFEHSTRLEIPKIKHAPTSLTQSLEEYLQDQDFETNRRQYLASKGAKASGGASTSRPFDIAKTNSSAKAVAAAQNFPSVEPNQPAATKPKGPPADLMDFFESIEQNQQQMSYEPTGYQQPSYVPQFQPQQQSIYARQTAFTAQPAFNVHQQPQLNQSPTQPTNPFGQYQNFQPAPQAQQPAPLQTQLQPQFTGAGFGGYGPQPDQQQGFNPYPQQPAAQAPLAYQPTGPASSNPFRQSMLSNNTGFLNQAISPTLTQSPTQARNPFSRQPAVPETAFVPQQQTGYTQSPFPQSTFPQSSFPPQQSGPPQPLQPQATGTNPFARPPAPTAPTSTSPTTPPTQPTSPPNQIGAVLSQATGSTNPFRQSAFVNQQTGLAWQHAPQTTMGGLESLETVEVFPRPGQQAAAGRPWG